MKQGGTVFSTAPSPSRRPWPRPASGSASGSSAHEAGLAIVSHVCGTARGSGYGASDCRGDC